MCCDPNFALKKLSLLRKALIPDNVKAVSEFLLRLHLVYLLLVVVPSGLHYFVNSSSKLVDYRAKLDKCILNSAILCYILLYAIYKLLYYYIL